MLDAINFILVLAALCASVGLILQIAACQRPFRHVWERYLGLLATAFFAFVSLNTLTQIAADQYSVTPQTIANWIAALILLSLLWAVLGRFEKYVDTVGRKSSIFTDFQKK